MIVRCDVFTGAIGWSLKSLDSSCGVASLYICSSSARVWAFSTSAIVSILVGAVAADSEWQASDTPAAEYSATGAVGAGSNEHLLEN